MNRPGNFQIILQMQAGRVKLCAALGSLLAGHPHYHSGEFSHTTTKPPLSIKKRL
jgi:hypothetical protein